MLDADALLFVAPVLILLSGRELFSLRRRPWRRTHPSRGSRGGRLARFGPPRRPCGSVGVDDKLEGRGIAVVLRLLGHCVVSGGRQRSVDDECGVLAEPLARP